MMICFDLSLRACEAIQENQIRTGLLRRCTPRNDTPTLVIASLRLVCHSFEENSKALVQPLRDGGSNPGISSPTLWIASSLAFLAMTVPSGSSLTATYRAKKHV